MITNPGSKTRVDEVADGIYRISTPVDVVPGGFSFNQYLVVDEEPLLFHTGPRRMFPLVREAVANRSIGRIDRLRAILRARLAHLAQHPDAVQPIVGFHWTRCLER